MRSFLRSLALQIIVIVSCYAALYSTWMGPHPGFPALVGITVASLGLLSLLQLRKNLWPKPQSEVQRPLQTEALAPSRASQWLILAGVLSIGTSFWLCRSGHNGLALLPLVLAAMSWRPLLDMREPGLDRRWQGGLLMLILSAAVLYRFWRFTAVPEGMITVDEPRIYTYTRFILEGLRESFNTKAGEGNLTFWGLAASMKAFGLGITSFRVPGLLQGLITVGLIALLGRELGGPKLGLAAAAFCAMAAWPVSFSRAEYLVANTYLPVLACYWLLLSGTRRGSPVSLLFSGFFFGLCFNVYKGGQLIPVLLLIGIALLCFLRPDWRKPLAWASAPFIAGALVGLAPLVLWVLKSPANAYYTYFSPLFAGFTAGADVQAAQGFLPKLDAAIGRIVDELPKVTTMFSSGGPLRAWYFVPKQPIIDQAMLFFLLAGMATALVKFRLMGYSLMLAWWFVGLTPTLVSNPALNMDERRIMMSLPATMLLAAAGLLSLLDLATRHLDQRRMNRAQLSIGLAFFALYGAHSWDLYFNKINRDPKLLAANHANFDNGLRAVFAEHHKGPVYVISTRKGTTDAWQVPDVLNELEEHLDVLTPIPFKVSALNSAYFEDQGLFGLLRARPPSTEGAPAPDPLILLTPFHYYLEPFLVEHLGGERVADVPLAQSLAGPDYTDVGMARDPKSATRLVRLRNFRPEALQALEARWLFPFRLQELSPPGGREKAQRAFVHDPEGVALMEDYAKAPQRWSSGNRTDFRMPEPWWWAATWRLPKVRPPYRLSMAWGLQAPVDGTYRFGLSATPFTVVKVDGKPVASFMPRLREDYSRAQAGVWGQSVQLKAGMHRLDIDALMISENGYFNQLVRVLWQAPGGEEETLPMSQLFPDPPR